MAGIFGFFNYDKEGPGIAKDAPKKKTIIVFFETFFRNVWKFITINFIYSLMCIPVLTNGLANVGLTNVCRNTARDKHSFGLIDFFETIKKNFKQSLAAGIINALIYALLIFDLCFFRGLTGTMGVIGNGVALALLVTFIMMNFYLWTLIITFNYTLKQAYSISFKLVFLNFKGSFLCLFVNFLILVANVVILFVMPSAKAFLLTFLIEAALLMVIYPGFNGLLVQFCTFSSIKKFIIDPYYKAHPGEDIEKRKRLGLEIEEEKIAEAEEALEEEEQEPEDDSIFND